jgi:hypothetical protein
VFIWFSESSNDSVIGVVKAKQKEGIFFGNLYLYLFEFVISTKKPQHQSSVTRGQLNSHQLANVVLKNKVDKLHQHHQQQRPVQAPPAIPIPSCHAVKDSGLAPIAVYKLDKSDINRKHLLQAFNAKGIDTAEAFICDLAPNLVILLIRQAAVIDQEINAKIAQAGFAVSKSCVLTKFAANHDEIVKCTELVLEDEWQETINTVKEAHGSKIRMNRKWLDRIYFCCLKLLQAANRPQRH